MHFYESFKTAPSLTASFWHCHAVAQKSSNMAASIRDKQTGSLFCVISPVWVYFERLYAYDMFWLDMLYKFSRVWQIWRNTERFYWLGNRAIQSIDVSLFVSLEIGSDWSIAFDCHVTFNFKDGCIFDVMLRMFYFS